MCFCSAFGPLKLSAFKRWSEKRRLLNATTCSQKIIVCISSSLHLHALSLCHTALCWHSSLQPVHSLVIQLCVNFVYCYDLGVSVHLKHLHAISIFENVLFPLFSIFNRINFVLILTNCCWHCTTVYIACFLFTPCKQLKAMCCDSRLKPFQIK